MRITKKMATGFSVFAILFLLGLAFVDYIPEWADLKPNAV